MPIISTNLTFTTYRKKYIYKYEKKKKLTG